jgi:aminoglycoside phosphotransferase (APT) family kinase protein
MYNALRENLLEYLLYQPTTGSNPDVVDFELLKRGPTSEVYGFTLTYDEDGQRTRQRLVLKVYENTVSGKDRALKERHALYHLRAARYSVPGVAAMEVDDTALGRPFILMEHIDGAPMADVLLLVDERGRVELAQQFVGLMTALHDLGHQVLVPRMGALSEFALINREIHTMRGLAAEYGLGFITPVLDWLYAQRVSAPQPVVTHRDFHPSNILLNAAGVPYVIDWGWQVSDPRYDLASTLAQLERDGAADFAAAVLAEYQRVTGGEVPHLNYFRVLVEVRWLIDALVTLKTAFDSPDEQAAYLDALIEPLRLTRGFITVQTGLTLPEAERLLE